MSWAALELAIGGVIAASVDEGLTEAFRLGEWLAINGLFTTPAVEVA